MPERSILERISAERSLGRGKTGICSAFPLLPGIKQHIEELSIIGTPAMKARGKKLLKSLAKESHG